MRILPPTLKGLLAVAVALPVGIVVRYVAGSYSQYGEFRGFSDTEGWSYVLTFAVFALPALLLTLGLVGRVLATNALRPTSRLAVGALGGAAGCWAIFSLYERAMFPHGLGFIWPLLIAMGSAGGLTIGLQFNRRRDQP